MRLRELKTKGVFIHNLWNYHIEVSLLVNTRDISSTKLFQGDKSYCQQVIINIKMKDSFIDSLHVIFFMNMYLFMHRSY